MMASSRRISTFSATFVAGVAATGSVKTAPPEFEKDCSVKSADMGRWLAEAEAATQGDTRPICAQEVNSIKSRLNDVLLHCEDMKLFGESGPFDAYRVAVQGHYDSASMLHDLINANCSSIASRSIGLSGEPGLGPAPSLVSRLLPPQLGSLVLVGMSCLPIGVAASVVSVSKWQLADDYERHGDGLSEKRARAGAIETTVTAATFSVVSLASLAVGFLAQRQPDVDPQRIYIVPASVGRGIGVNIRVNF